VDADKVDNSNLQRQVLYTTLDEGCKKVEAGSSRLKALNPHVNIQVYDTAITPENAFALIRDYDLVLDCTDNFPTRYLINDVCSILKKPNIYASVAQFEGLCSVFCTPKGPCYRCLYPEPPPPGLVPNCAEDGILGVLPGLLGTLQAAEAVKLILELGEPLIGRLLRVDTLGMNFATYKLNQKADCLLCGLHTPFAQLPRYETYCGIPIPSMSVEELKAQRAQVFLLDVREPFEYELCNLKGYLVPLGALATRLDEVRSKSQGLPIVVHCKAGPRSQKAAQLMLAHGFKEVKFLQGGILEWIKTCDPAMMSY